MSVYYTLQGQGEVIILLHGWGCDHRFMQPISSRLCPSYQVMNFDLFGFGQSHEVEIDSFENYIDQLHNFFNELKIYNPILLGHSFGGRLALFYALKYPTKALILTSSAGIAKRLSWYSQFRIYLHRHHIWQNQGSKDYQQASLYLRKLLVLAVNQDITPHLEKIFVPTCLIWGDQDKETPCWMGKLMEKKIPQATLFIFEGEDHFAYLHEIDRFCNLVLSYLIGL